MELNDDTAQKILRSTLEEINQELDGRSDHDPCVICLEQITEKAQAVPCNHSNYDFVCLVNWLENVPTCPLCKSTVNLVIYNRTSAGQYDTYRNVSVTSSYIRETPRLRYNRPRPRLRARRSHQAQRTEEVDLVLERRKEVYRQQMYSLHVGSNRWSGYHDITPTMFVNDQDGLLSKAKKFIRRELKVFEFLKIADSTTLQKNHLTNAEYLLHFVIALLKTVDLKGSEGQAEDMLQEFLGRSYARLFLHELRSWLRSPYNSLDAYDQHVQYREVESMAPLPEATGEGNSKTG